MPLPLAWLGAVSLWAIISGFIYRTLLWVVPWIMKLGILGLGLSVITYTGTTAVIDYGFDLLDQKIGEIPLDYRYLVDLMGVPDAIGIVVSGMTTALSIKAVVGFRRWRAGRPYVLEA